MGRITGFAGCSNGDGIFFFPPVPLFLLLFIFVDFIPLEPFPFISGGPFFEVDFGSVQASVSEAE
jgi:hypothetical protein